MKLIRTALALVFAAISIGVSGVVVEQTGITNQADYGSGFGQSFLLPSGQKVAAIQLHIDSVGNGGGAAELKLWKATGRPGSHFQRLDREPVASGRLEKSDVLETPGWVTIILDQPYVNSSSSSVYFVFEIELLTSGSNGWNNYSYTTGNQYDGGHSVFWSGWDYAIRDGQDLAFRVLNSEDAPTDVVPSQSHRPVISLSVTPASGEVPAIITAIVHNSSREKIYSLYSSNKLATPQAEWTFVGRRRGRDRAIEITHRLPRSLPSTEFYFVKIEDR